MKKLISAILALTLFVGGLFSLVSCEPKHSFSVDWALNDTHHWHVCNDKDCAEISDKGEHVMENHICKVCGYCDANSVRMTVSEAEFEAALRLNNFKNVTMTGSITFEGYSSEFFAQICENASSYRSTVNGQADDDDYYEIASDGSFYYYHQEDGKWIRETTPEYYGISEDAFLSSFYFDFSGKYNDLTFDIENGCYVLESYSYRGLPFRAQIRFEDGALASFRLIGETGTMYIAYSLYGSTAIALPSVGSYEN